MCDSLTRILEVKNLTKSFGRLVALNEISLGLEEKSISILIGPNGSGKTTLLNVVAGFYHPDSGSVEYKSTNITGQPPHKIYKMGIARTFQIPALFWKLTVLENMLVAERQNPGEYFGKAIFPRFWKREEEQAIDKAKHVLETIGLVEHWNKPAQLLSGGQMKLLELGRALMADASLLLVDEPISGINPTLAHEIFSRIVRLRDELGLSFLIVEHRLDIAMDYVDHMIAMALGQLIASGRPDQVVNDTRVVEAYLGK